MNINEVRRELLIGEYFYQAEFFEPRRLSFLRDGTIGKGADWNERYWSLRFIENEPVLSIFREDSNKLLEVRRCNSEKWSGVFTESDRRSVHISAFHGNSKPPEPTRIVPKVIHFCWFSDEPMREDFKANVVLWKERLPDHEIIIWGKTFQKLPLLVNQPIFDQARNHAERADIFRYEVLYRYGGIYLDLDCVPIQLEKSDRLVLMESSTPAGLVLSSDWYSPWPLHNTFSSLRHVDICFMASCPEHPVLGDALSRLPRHFFSREFLEIDAHSRTGSRFLEVVVDDYCSGAPSMRRKDGGFESKDVLVHCTDVVSQIRAGPRSQILHLAKGTWVGPDGWNWPQSL